MENVQYVDLVPDNTIKLRICGSIKRSKIFQQHAMKAQRGQ
jgi:hypothetical protein